MKNEFENEPFFQEIIKKKNIKSDLIYLLFKYEDILLDDRSDMYMDLDINDCISTKEETKKLEDDIKENKEIQELVNKLIKYIHERY